jgi:hypothetical protein
VRRAARKDANHGAIVRDLVAIGAECFETHQIPGLLDVIVAYRGRLVWLEIKDGQKPPSERRLTKAEQETIGRLRRVAAPVHIVENTEQALRAIGATE